MLVAKSCTEHPRISMAIFRRSENFEYSFMDIFFGYSFICWLMILFYRKKTEKEEKVTDCVFFS